MLEKAVSPPYSGTSCACMQMHSGGRSRKGLSVWKLVKGTTVTGSCASRRTSCMSGWPGKIGAWGSSVSSPK